jgi:lipopolysaccharide transport system permease protein
MYLTFVMDHEALISLLIRREIAGRYRGSALGLLWSLLTPLFMLAIYTFTFSTVFRSRWAGQSDSASTGEFAIILFAGLIVFQLFAEVVTRAPNLILAHANYVKKVIFPLEILPLVALGSALFHAGVSLLVLFAFQLAIHGAIPPTALLLPLVIAPFCLLIVGLSWFLASLGTYYRDIGQVLGTLITAIMFLSPIFFPLSALPAWLQPWLIANPVAFPVEQARAVLIFGQLPDFSGLTVYTLIAAAIAWLGYLWFQKTRKGFADVL